MFTIGSSISFGWEQFKKRFWFFALSLLLYVAVLGLINGIFNELAHVGPSLALVCALANWAVQLLAGIGLINFFLKAHDSPESTSLMDFWKPALFWSFLGMSILVTVAAVAPFALVIGVSWILGFSQAILVVESAVVAPQFLAYSFFDPISIICIVLLLLSISWGIYIGIRLLFARYLVVDLAMGPVQSLKRSYAITKGSFWKLVLFLIVLVLINLVGAMLLLVGLLVSVPVTLLATVHAYRTLEHSASELTAAA